MGTGHFFRGLALAEVAVDRGVETQLLCASLPSGLATQARASALPVRRLDVKPGSQEDAAALASLAGGQPGTAIVVDGYHFSPGYYETVAPWASVVAAVDDLGHQRFPVDMLVNTNPGSERIGYDIPAHCVTLLGLEYALLRRQFREKREELSSQGAPSTVEEVHRVLVFLGGGDPTNETGKALRALQVAGYSGETDIVLGAANTHGNAIRRLAAELPGRTRILRNVTEMAAVMERQQLALCAAGSVSWELACVGVPMLQLVVADNQRTIAEELSNRGVAVFAGRRETVTADDLGRCLSTLLSDVNRREGMARRGWDLVDGQGAVRVMDVLQGLDARTARAEDEDEHGCSHEQMRGLEP